ncbi:Thioesterase superfamily protein [Microbacterium sp. C448]|nr:Thioesterase superfamily protein [Microbacterium sp. C448]
MTDPTTTNPSGVRLHVPMPLRWGDLDAFNHVNNTSMLKLLEEARIRAFWRSTGEDGENAPSTAVLDSGLEHGVLSLIARQEIEYLRPVPYQRRPLDVQIWFGRIGGSSIEICYEVYSPLGPGSGDHEKQELYARSSAVLVMVDAESGRPRRLTDEQRAAWTPHLGEPIVYARRG